MLLPSARTDYNSNSLLQRFETTIEDVLTERMSVEEFQVWFSDLLEVLEAKSELIHESYQDPKYIAGFPIAYELGLDAMNCLDEGFNECSLFIADPVPEHLLHARLLIREGIAQLRRSYDAILDEEEILTSDGTI